jgi:hypothetical protein
VRRCTVNEQIKDMDIVDIYYADCDQAKGPHPQWSTVRSGDQLTDERSLERLRDQLRTLRRKRTKLDFAFGEEVIKVNEKETRSVKTLLQLILKLPPADAKLKDMGDVLAAKYLLTPYSRTRLFMVARVRMGKELRLFTLVADLKSTFEGEYIEPDSLDFASRTIPNWIGDLKKGAIYPGVKDGERSEDAIEIYDENQTRYYPQSLECVPRQSEDKEAKSLLKALGGVGKLTPHQVAGVIRELRGLTVAKFGADELAKALEKNGVEVDPERVAGAWRREFFTSGYRISPGVLGRDSVTITIKLDDFEIQCPLSYYPDRIVHTEQGGLHHLHLSGTDYRELKAGRGRIQFDEENG